MKDLFSLKGRTALITGGSRGIGKMIAKGFIAQGAKVYICARRAGVCEEAAAELSSAGTCIALPADVATADGIRALAQSFSAREPALDILVNNAGAASKAPFGAFTEGAWDEELDLNLKSPFYLTQAFVGALKAAASPETPAKVINVTSVDAFLTRPVETYAYHASKAGLTHLTRRMAAALIKDHIAVTALAPGSFPSDMNTAARDQAETAATRAPAGRVGTEEDMAGAAIFLASRAGDYVIGSTLTLDGGVAFASSFHA